MRMWILGILAFIVLYLAFLREVRNAGAIRRPSIATGGPKVTAQTELPRFSGALGHFERARGFGDFLRGHRGQVVALDIEIPNQEFEGDKLQSQWWFVLFDSCIAALEPGQRPAVPNCHGNSIHIEDGADGRSSIKLESGQWIVRGLFRVDETGGPEQGLMWVHLAPV